MKEHWGRLLRDETGVILSSELVMVGTVGVLALVVGMEAVSSAVVQELNDFAGAIGAISQSFNYRSIAKLGHARVSGSGFNDLGDFCDCSAIVQTDVAGRFSGGRITGGALAIGQAKAAVSAPIVSEPIIEERILPERIIEEKVIEQVAPKRVPCEGEIIEEHIIRRRISPDCAADCSVVIERQKTSDTVKPKQVEEPEKKPEPKKKPETKKK
jgi:hypothetical protein